MTRTGRQWVRLTPLHPVLDRADIPTHQLRTVAANIAAYGAARGWTVADVALIISIVTGLPVAERFLP